MCVYIYESIFIYMYRNIYLDCMFEYIQMDVYMCVCVLLKKNVRSLKKETL